MGVISGIGGVVNGVSEMQNWEVSSKAALADFVSSSTKGGTGRTIGVTDWSGSYNALGALPVSMPGEALSFTGSIEGTKGVTGTAIVNDVEITWDIEGGKPIKHAVNFSANGALSIGAAVATDVTVSNAPTSIGMKVELGTLVASPVWTELADVRTITLKISAKNQSYADSSSAGGTKRVKGPIDFSLAIAVYTDETLVIPTPNTIKAVRLYTAAAAYWELLWAMFQDASGIQVDRETAKIVGCTLNASMCATTLISATPTAGSIKKPGGATFWPV